MAGRNCELIILSISLCLFLAGVAPFELSSTTNQSFILTRSLTLPLPLPLPLPLAGAYLCASLASSKLPQTGGNYYV